MAQLLDALSRLCRLYRESRAAAWISGLVLLACVGAIAMVQPQTELNDRVYQIDANSSYISLLDRYVRATGPLNRGQIYRTSYTLGTLTLQGSQFVPMLIPGAADPLFVEDSGLPTAPGPVTLVGRLVPGTGAQPPYYLEVQTPIDVVLNNRLARIGIGVGSALLIWIGLCALVARAHFVFHRPVKRSTAALEGGPGLSIYGSLGPRWEHALVRAEEVKLERTPREWRVTPLHAQTPWELYLRRVLSAQPRSVATAFGDRPGLLVRFIDERELTRQILFVSANPRDFAPLQSAPAAGAG